jgi:hypothetical protein
MISTQKYAKSLFQLCGVKLTVPHRLPARSCVKQRLSSYQRFYNCAVPQAREDRRDAHVKGRGGYAEMLRCGLAKGKTSAPEVSACYFFVYQR